jgi:murein DD-endopeptidase / murein LD-carboxypeptidase
MIASAQRGAAIAAAAQSQIGVSFRLHGRTRGIMLDCVGLVQAALMSAGYAARAPANYALRGDFFALASEYLATSGLKQQSQTEILQAQILQGDIVLVQCAPVQNHLIIAVNGGFVHAHAGLRRIVFTPGEIPWPKLQIWRGSD